MFNIHLISDMKTTASRIARFSILVLPFLSMHASAQVLESLVPQPRQAYQYFTSAVFTPNGQPLLLDPASPAWSEASLLNAELRKRNIDTLVTRLWTEADSTESAFWLGVRSPMLNRIQNQINVHRVDVTSTYPGPEGYLLDVIPMRAVLNASDEMGLRYGINTFIQLIDRVPGLWHVEGLRIVDAPEFTKRWLYYSTNIQVGSNITRAKNIWNDALRWRLNGVQLNDSKFSRPTTLPKFYFDSLKSLKDYAAARKLDIIPGVMPFGYSNSFLFHDPNLASGLPVVRQQFVIERDTARLVPKRTLALSNGGFETHNGNNFPGFRFIDKPGQMSFVDTQIKHSGNASVRFENFSQADPQYGNGRVSFWTRVTPFTQYHVSGWVRTENLVASSGVNCSVIDVNSRSLVFNELKIPSTTDWRRIDFTFNSLDADSLGIYWGVWGGRSGKIWWDDLLVEEVPMINLLRREGTPLKVEHPQLRLLYTEGVDFEPVRDPLMGSIPYAGEYTAWHTPPTFRIKSGGALQNGDTILISYYHAQIIYSGQVAATMSEPKVYEIVEREFRMLDSLLKPQTYMMQHDEIRVMNWDAGDQQRGMTPAQILADNVDKCMDIIHRSNPSADVWVWSDMFDEYHNAVMNYYLVNGDLRGCADLLPKSLGIINWNSQAGKVQNSLGFFQTKGFRQMSAPYYDQDENQIRRWKEWTRTTSDFNGMIYTTWEQKYDHLEAFGEYAWNHAPYIYHTPPQMLSPNGRLSISLSIRGDRYDPAWLLTNATLNYRTQPGAAFTQYPLAVQAGNFETFEIALPPNTQWVQWFIAATDNRGWTTRVPLGDTVFFELGSIPVRVDQVLASDAFQIHGIYPNPIVENRMLTIDLSSERVEGVSIRTTDLLGRTIFESTFDTKGNGFQTHRLDLNDHPKGIFFLHIQRGSDTWSSKVLLR